MDIVTEAVVETFGNPLATAEEAVEEDTNAVVSPYFPEWRVIGRMLSSRWLLTSLQVSTVGFAAFLGYGELFVFNSWAPAFGVRLHVLNYIFAGCRALALGCVVLILVSASRALAEPGALLDPRLGAGKTMISASEAASVRRGRLLVAPFTTFLLFFGVMIVGWGFAQVPVVFGVGLEPGETRAEAAFKGVMNLAMGLTVCVVSPTITTGWWTSMRAGSALGRDAVLEVTHAARVIDPLDAKAWTAKVVEPAVRLNSQFELMSETWGPGLAGATLTCWIGSFGAFVQAINSPWVRAQAVYYARDRGDTPCTTDDACAGHVCTREELSGGWPECGEQPDPNEFRDLNLRICVMLLFPPFILALDVVSTSHACDILMDVLNSRRTKDTHDEILWLETKLKQLNKGQGLGIAVFSTVLDRSTLRQVFVTVIGTVSTLVTTVIAFTEEAATGDDVCLLTEEQRLAFRAVAMSWGLESCAYNVSLNEIMDY